MPEGASSGPAAVARLVKRLREDLPLTQDKFAKSCGLGVGTIKNIEGPKPGWRPRPDTLRRVSTGLGLEEGHLAGMWDGLISDDRAAEDVSGEQPSQRITFEMLQRFEKKLDAILKKQNEILKRRPRPDAVWGGKVPRRPEPE